MLLTAWVAENAHLQGISVNKVTGGYPELGLKIRLAETANLRVELLRLLHIAYVSCVCDDC